MVSKKHACESYRGLYEIFEAMSNYKYRYGIHSHNELFINAI